MIEHERAELARLESEFPALLKTSDEAKTAFARAIEACQENAAARSRLQNAIAERDRAARVEAEREKKAAAETAYPTTRHGQLTDEALSQALAAIEGSTYVGQPGSCRFLGFDLQVCPRDEFCMMALYRHIASGGQMALVHEKIKQLLEAGTVTARAVEDANEKRTLFGYLGTYA